MASKNCTKCGELKPLSEFYLKQYRCKACQKELTAAYRKTKKGLVYVMYGSQRDNSKQRGHSEPAYTLKELREWLFNQSLFHELYDKWVESGWDKNHKPSCDRIDDYLGYSLDRIKLVTWSENNNKAFSDTKNGVNNKRSSSVIQLNINNEIVGHYYSQAQAYRSTGIGQPNINMCCKGLRPLAGGFKWAYA